MLPRAHPTDRLRGVVLRDVSNRIRCCGASPQKRVATMNWGPRNGVETPPKNGAVMFRTSDENYRQIATAAAADDRSISSWVRRAVEAVLQGEVTTR